MKICTKCDQKKESSAFHKDKKNRDGLSSACAVCRNASKRVNKPYKNGKPLPFVSSHVQKENPVSIKIQSEDPETLLRSISERHSACVTLTLSRKGSYVLGIHSRPIQKAVHGLDLKTLLLQAMEC